MNDDAPRSGLTGQTPARSAGLAVLVLVPVRQQRTSCNLGTTRTLGTAVPALVAPGRTAVVAVAAGRCRRRILRLRRCTQLAENRATSRTKSQRDRNRNRGSRFVVRRGSRRDFVEVAAAVVVVVGRIAIGNIEVVAAAADCCTRQRIEKAARTAIAAAVVVGIRRMAAAAAAVAGLHNP